MKRKLPDFDTILQEMGCTLTVMKDAEKAGSFFATKRRMYMGMDPTAESLHVGNIPGLLLGLTGVLCGHDFFILLGGGTALIGDPSGKKTARQKSRKEAIEHNKAKIHKQVDAFIDSFFEYAESRFDLEGVTRGKVLRVDNLDWLEDLSLIDFLREVGATSNLQVMLSKEFVKSRLGSGSGLSFAEFSYQLLQGLDFAFLLHRDNVEVQIGGVDQTGNMLTGFDVFKSTRDGETFLGADVRPDANLGVLTFGLLTTSEGDKFRKTEGNATWLNPAMTSPFDLFQSLIKVEDSRVEHFLKILSLDWLAHDVKDVKEMAPMLASSVIEMVHGVEAKDSAIRITELLKPGHISQLATSDFEKLVKLLPASMVCRMSKQNLLSSNILDLIDTMIQDDVSKSNIRQLCKNQGLFINDKNIDSVSDSMSENDLVDGRFALLSLGKNKKFVISVE